ncbi:uncharacterized protein LOC144619741 [Crassostrea virginica]
MVSNLYSLTDKPATKPVHTTSQDVSDTPINGGIFKNNYVFDVIIFLIGVFVLFFSICVITYTYFKCFRKSTNINEIKDNDLRAHYQSLDVEAMQSEATGHQAYIEQRRGFTSDSSYISPVFVRTEGQIETNRVHINQNEVIPESEFNTHDQANKETIAILPSHDLTGNIYTEITEDDSDLESANSTADTDNENKKDIRGTETLYSDSLYINESK